MVGTGDGPPEATKVLVEDARLLLDALGWDKASLVGHSTGGQGALMPAARYPERVGRMVIIESGPQIRPEESVRADLRARPRVFASVKGALSDARLSFPAADEALLRDRVEHDLVPNRDGSLTSRTAAGLRQGTVKRDDFSAAECWAAWRSVSAHTLLVSTDARGHRAEVRTRQGKSLFKLDFPLL